MLDRDAPITSIDEARAYFEAMGCSHFHMSRENFDRYDEYKALEISKDLENGWRAEKLEEALENLTDDSHDRELWSRHSNLVELYMGIGSRARRKLSFPRLVDATYITENRATPFDRILIAETVLGRAFYRDDGMVCEASALGRRDIVSDLHSFVERLLDFDEPDQKLDERRKAAMTLNEELKRKQPRSLMPAWLGKIIGR